PLPTREKERSGAPSLVPLDRGGGKRGVEPLPWSRSTRRGEGRRRVAPFPTLVRHGEGGRRVAPFPGPARRGEGEREEWSPFPAPARRGEGRLEMSVGVGARLGASASRGDRRAPLPSRTASRCPVCGRPALNHRAR